MTPERLREILDAVARGALDRDAALEAIKRLPFEDLGFAKVDHHRTLRSGVPEAVFSAGKTPDQIVAVASALRASGQSVLVTRLSPEAAAVVTAALPELTYEPGARLAYWRRPDLEVGGRGTIVVAAAGTADLPVAEEAALTAELMGNAVDRVYDVGVAGIHRLFAHHDRLRQASVLIVVAGMEGALPSVVGGLVDRPLIAVPTSIGYGASVGGLAALLAMLNSCAAGVTVVNIDNGFGAGVAASLINRAA
ncbi:MAG TPA: nickel pincer cofactor biosynthesis protein LarB [Candidatus Dormibacteraeota bacterium]|nr:nickel pincer cofactor biosynthesis protein LarB [Candidatus Dormibacteraeota bacterium]